MGLRDIQVVVEKVDLVTVSIYPKAEMGLRVKLETVNCIRPFGFNLPEGRDGFKSQMCEIVETDESLVSIYPKAEMGLRGHQQEIYILVD